jgi:hypothetical protein
MKLFGYRSSQREFLDDVIAKPDTHEQVIDPDNSNITGSESLPLLGIRTQLKELFIH